MENGKKMYSVWEKCGFSIARHVVVYWRVSQLLNPLQKMEHDGCWPQCVEKFFSSDAAQNGQTNMVLKYPYFFGRKYIFMMMVPFSSQLMLVYRRVSQKFATNLSFRHWPPSGHPPAGVYGWMSLRKFAEECISYIFLVLKKSLQATGQASSLSHDLQAFYSLCIADRHVFCHQQHIHVNVCIHDDQINCSDFVFDHLTIQSKLVS